MSVVSDTTAITTLLKAKQERLLLTDDRKARRAAQKLMIPCIGLVGDDCSCKTAWKNLVCPQTARDA